MKVQISFFKTPFTRYCSFFPKKREGTVKRFFNELRRQASISSLITFICALGLLGGGPAMAQSPQWEWVRGASASPKGEHGNAVIADAEGNVYVAGNFESDSVLFGTNTLINVGAQDMFLVKYDASGNVIWSRSAGGGGVDQINGIALDPLGNVYIAGYYYDSLVTFGTWSPPSGYGKYDGFIGKYDINGNLVWVKAINGPWTEYVSAINTDLAGNLYVTGAFASTTASVGGIVLTNSSWPSSDEYYLDGFIIKYDTDGNAYWGKSLGGWFNERPESIAVDQNGYVSITGNTNSQFILFGEDSIVNGNSSFPQVFTARYDAAGNELWAKIVPGTASDYATGIATDLSGNTYVSGYFYGPSITFGGSFELTNTNMTTGDFFVAKYAANGDVLWAKSYGTPNLDITRGICTDDNNNFYLAGWFSTGVLSLDSITLTCNDAPNYGDAFIAKFDSSGQALWGVNMGGEEADYAANVFVSPAGEVYVTGGYSGKTGVFGAHALTNADTTGVEYDFFVAKLTQFPTGVHTISISEPIDVFPNPGTGKFTVRSRQQAINSVHVINSLGQLVYQSDGRLMVTEVDLSSQPEGVYYMQMKTERGTASRKVVLRR